MCMCVCVCQGWVCVCVVVFLNLLTEQTSTRLSQSRPPQSMNGLSVSSWPVCLPASKVSFRYNFYGTVFNFIFAVRRILVERTLSPTELPQAHWILLFAKLPEQPVRQSSSQSGSFKRHLLPKEWPRKPSSAKRALTGNTACYFKTGAPVALVLLLIHKGQSSFSSLHAYMCSPRVPEVGGNFTGKDWGFWQVL